MLWSPHHRAPHTPECDRQTSKVLRRSAREITSGAHHGVNLLASFQTSLNWNIGVNKAGHCLINTSPIKQSNGEQFRATGTSQYPAAMDRALVVAFLETLVTTPTTCPYKGWGAQVQQPRQDGQGKYDRTERRQKLWRRSRGGGVRSVHESRACRGKTIPEEPGKAPASLLQRSASWHP